MFFENGQLPLQGGLLVAGLLYVGASLFVTGPLVGERMIDKLGWASQCTGYIHAEIDAQQPETSIIPKLGCNELFGGWFGREGAEFCAVHGDIFDNNPLTRSLETAENAKREVQRKRMEYAASRAGSQCDCAVTTTLENSRTALAIYAGSARLITPPSIKLLGSDLKSSLNSPACAMKG